MSARRRRGGGSRNGLPCRALCFVLGRLLPPKAPEHKFWPGKFFSFKNFPPHSSQNDQCDAGIILSHVCWGRTPAPPPPPRHGRKGSPGPNPPPGTATKEGEGGGWATGLPCHPPPAKQFSSRPMDFPWLVPMHACLICGVLFDSHRAPERKRCACTSTRWGGSQQFAGLTPGHPCESLQSGACVAVVRRNAGCLRYGMRRRANSWRITRRTRLALLRRQTNAAPVWDLRGNGAMGWTPPVQAAVPEAVR